MDIQRQIYRALQRADEVAMAGDGRESAGSLGDGWQLLCIGRDSDDILDNENPLGVRLWHGDTEYYREWGERPSSLHVVNWVLKIMKDEEYAGKFQHKGD